jgi:hypothetical protein
VLVHLDTNEIFELNDTSARVCELLEHDTTRDVIIARLLEEFDVDRDRASAEVDGLLGTLEQRGLLARD